MKRLDAVLTAAGICSRRQAAEWIRQGYVSVDGQIVRSAALHIPSTARVAVNGQEVATEEFVYLMMNKPLGAVCATSGAEKCVVDWVPKIWSRRGIFPVGRLDKDTSGLLILTNDGVFGHRLTSPHAHVPKVYLAQLQRELDEATICAFEKGMTLRDGLHTLPAKVEAVADRLARVTVYEGKYHQVRRMFAACGNFVCALHREQIGDLVLDSALSAGQVRELTAEEKNLLNKK